MPQRRSCPRCHRDGLYTRTASVSASSYLPDLGSAFHPVKINIFVCSRCGYLETEVVKGFLAKLSDSSKWEKV